MDPLEQEVVQAEAKTSDKTRAFFAKITLPVNPDFDIERDSGTVDYVPPAVANNRLVNYANAAVEVAEKVVVLNRHLERLRLERKDAERKVTRLKSELLFESPVTTAASKNLLLTEAHVRAAAKRLNRLSELERAESAVSVLEDRCDVVKSEVENLRYMMDTIEIAGKNVGTHLSWLKKEDSIR